MSHLKGFQRNSRRIYEVAGKRTTSFEEATARAVAIATARHESVCIDTIVANAVVERIDVTAALSVDFEEKEL